MHYFSILYNLKGNEQQNFLAAWRLEIKFLLTWMLQENLLSLIMLFEIKASAFIFYNNILRLNRLWFCNINANKNFIF